MNAKAFYENNILKLMLEDDSLHASQIEAAFIKKLLPLTLRNRYGCWTNHANDSVCCARLY